VKYLFLPSGTQLKLSTLPSQLAIHIHTFKTNDDVVFYPAHIRRVSFATTLNFLLERKLRIGIVTFIIG
jgi:hypothetical protein